MAVIFYARLNPFPQSAFSQQSWILIFDNSNADPKQCITSVLQMQTYEENPYLYLELIFDVFFKKCFEIFNLSKQKHAFAISSSS
jgi:hypothetical protein